MPEARWDKVGALLEEVGKLPPDQRRAYLEKRCEEEALREEVLSLLEAEGRAGGFFEHLRTTVSSFQGAEDVESAGPWGQPGSDPLGLEGRQVGRYKVGTCLGGGGMGVVYRARDSALERQVALKFLPSRLAIHPEAEERFIREAKATAALDHPNIATVHEIGRTEDGQRFIAMAYYDGETLEEALAREGPLPIEEALGYAMQIAEGLVRAHDAGIVHRDIKPANVMVTEGGRVKLVDFGLAQLADRSRLTDRGQRVGTAAYMSPEQAKGEAVGPQADLWAVGVVLYEMLTLARPFEGERQTTILHAILHEEPVPVGDRRSDAPPALEATVERCLEKDPEQRYASAEALLQDLRALRSTADVASLDTRSSKAWLSRKALSRLFLRRLSRRDRLVGVVVAALIALVAALGWTLWPVKSAQDSGVPAVSQHPIAEHSAAERSVAVLPFTHLAATDSADYFSLGMTDELLTRLGQIEGLSVIARTSVMQYQETDKTIPEIGRELGVDLVVEGTVQQVGSQVRIRAQLIDARTGERVRAQGFTRPFQNVLKLQSALAHQIAEELQIELLPETRRQLTQAPTVDSAAYALYLQGRHLRFRETGTSLTEAVRLLRRSVQMDSTFAAAWAMLSTSAWLAPVMGGRLPDGLVADSLARAAARRAVALDSTSAEACIAMGNVLEALDLEFPAAGPWMKRAILLNPGLANAHRQYGLYLSLMGRFEAAEPHLDKATRLNPAAPGPWHVLGWNDLLRGAYPEGRRHFERALTLQPDYWLTRAALAELNLAQGQTQTALREARRAVEVNPSPYSLGILGRALARAGRPDSARTVLGHMREEFGPSPFGEAVVYASLGQTGRALNLIEEAGGQLGLKVFPAWEPLRGRPRYERLLEEMGLDEASVQETMARLKAMEGVTEQARR